MVRLVKCTEKTETRDDKPCTYIVRSINCTDTLADGSQVGKRCPECIVNGQVSTINISIGMVTHAGINAFYDEQGRHHSHDRNVSRSTWSCSQGHTGDYRSVKGCGVGGM